MEKITYGIRNVYYAIKAVSAGLVSFAPPVPMPGAYEISLPPVGDPVKVYADDGVYYNQTVNQGYDGKLSLYAIPESFQRDVMGMVKDSNGVMVESADAVQKEAALLFEFSTDEARTKRAVLYSCAFGRSEIASKTKSDTLEPNGFSIPVTASPLDGSAYVKANILGDKNVPAWASWFSSVYMPSTTNKFAVTVTVSDSSGPLAGALVVCGGLLALTGADGVAMFLLPPGSYDLLISKDGYTAKVDSVTVSAAAVSKPVTLTVK